ncbi:sigma-70 family RNA polymerase sigma factor [Paenibacillus xanthanilyticus]|uniref:Sigma-70 family RNA polymerase sigma factor n=1 Tax=Paenibacillus xanthanilyticus TaxID=1783531 RepID=A0ABV8K0A5_9BACL
MQKQVQLAKEGNHEAFIGLITDMKTQLNSIAYAILRSEEDSADAIQETILRTYKSLRKLKHEAFFQTWVIRILIHECNRMLGKRPPCKPLHSEAIGAAAAVDPAYGDIDLREAVDRLEPQLRIVIILFYFQDMPVGRIGELLELSEGAVKTRLHRARKKLLHTLDIGEGGVEHEPSRS